MLKLTVEIDAYDKTDLYNKLNEIIEMIKNDKYVGAVGDHNEGYHFKLSGEDESSPKISDFEPPVAGKIIQAARAVIEAFKKEADWYSHRDKYRTIRQLEMALTEYDLSPLTAEEEDEIFKNCEDIYNEGGQSAVFKYADSKGIGYEYCKACECRSPQIDHICLVCGQTTFSPPEVQENEKISDTGGGQAGKERRIIPVSQLVIGNEYWDISSNIVSSSFATKFMFMGLDDNGNIKMKYVSGGKHYIGCLDENNETIFPNDEKSNWYEEINP
jgi:hypothetical protein